MKLAEYLVEIRKIQLLQPQEEHELWYRYKEKGDEAARCHIIESYQPLVFKNAAAFRNLDNIMDVVQEGVVGLIEAVDRYDWNRGVAFSLFATHRIRGRMLDFLQKEGGADLACMEGQSADGSGLSLKETVIDMSLPVAEQAETHFLTSCVQEVMARLPQKERIVLESIYLCSQETKEIAARMNLSTSHIYRLQKSGVRRVRGMLSKFMHYWGK